MVAGLFLCSWMEICESVDGNLFVRLLMVFFPPLSMAISLFLRLCIAIFILCLCVYIWRRVFVFCLCVLLWIAVCASLYVNLFVRL